MSSATTTYQYDAEDRLTQVTTPTDVIQYQYDGLGRRNVRTLNGVVTKYVYDQEDILFEFDENEQIKARYTHGPGIDEPISVDRDTDGDGTLDTTYYYHYDGLGSVIALTDSAGNVVQTYVYDAFGKIVDQSGSVENTYTYTGREWDAEAGLYYYRARYYDPTLGRFINGDPIGFAGGDINFYVYVQNNPVNFIDPLGLFNPVKGVVAVANVANAGRLYASGYLKLTATVVLGVTSVGAPASVGTGLLGVWNIASATSAQERAMQQWFEAFQEDWSDASWRNLKGLLPLGQHIDDPCEPTIREFLKSKYKALEEGTESYWDVIKEFGTLLM